MNKIFTRIGVAFVGIAMAIGVGVAVGTKDNRVQRADAGVQTKTVSASDFTEISSAALNQTVKAIGFSSSGNCTITSTQLRLF